MNSILLKDGMITSLELLEQINLFRSQLEGKAELEHKNLLAVIRDEFEEEIGQLKIQPSSYINSQNKVQPMYRLTTAQAKQVLVRESKKVRKAVVAYIEKLESQAFKPPQTLSQALRLAADQAEQIETLEAERAENAPKVEFFDAVAGCGDAIDIGSAAKVLNMGVGRNRLFEVLRRKGVLMGNNQPYQEYIDRGYFRAVEQKYNKPDGSVHISIKTVVYQKGLDYIRKILVG